MSADRLREAARLMRERAEAADYVRSRGTDWFIETAWCDNTDSSYAVKSAGGAICHGSCEEEAEHIASWHPAVAVAVADWLWEAANHEEIHGDINCKAGCLHPTCRVADRALAVANAYLGSAS